MPLASTFQLWSKQLPLLGTHITISHISTGPKALRDSQPLNHGLNLQTVPKQTIPLLSQLSPGFVTSGKSWLTQSWPEPELADGEKQKPWLQKSGYHQGDVRLKY